MVVTAPAPVVSSSAVRCPVRRLASVLCAFSLLGLACGDDSSQDAGPPAVDAGPDATPVPTGNTAQDIYAPASELAASEISDWKLYEGKGDYLAGGGSECVPSNNQSYWKFTFISPSTGKQISYTWYRSDWQTNETTVNPEGMLLMVDGWMNSDEAVAKMVSGGYILPDPADATTHVSGKLFMFPYEGDFQGQPVWQFVKSTLPPGGTLTTETWWVMPIPGGTTFAACSGPDYQTLTCQEVP
jgi:hypothetical protein